MAYSTFCGRSLFTGATGGDDDVQGSIAVGYHGLVRSRHPTETLIGPVGAGLARRRSARDNSPMMPMKQLTTVSLLGLVLMGCQSSQSSAPGSSDRAADARAVFQRFENALKDKNADVKVDCLTDKAVNGFYLFWRELAEAEGFQFDPDEGFYDLTKDAAVEAGVAADDTLRLVVPVKLKHSSKIVITFVGSGKGCRMDKFEAVK
jgi:hypothetical protein